LAEHNQSRVWPGGNCALPGFTRAAPAPRVKPVANNSNVLHLL
jgi:hypothetical protein